MLQSTVISVNPLIRSTPLSLERPLTFHHRPATRIQIALNVALPACSLCINRRLYKIASVNDVAITRQDKRRAVIQDLLIGVGIPILQIIVRECVQPFTVNRFFTKIPCRVHRLTESLHYIRGFWPIVLQREYAADHLPLYLVARDNRYRIFLLLWWVSWPSFALWFPGSLVPVRTTYIFYRYQRQFSELMLAPGLSRGRYLRLMAIGAVEMFGTIPVGMRDIVASAKEHMTPWKSWANTHRHYSTVMQVAGFIWKNDPDSVYGLELFRWSLVACAFLFFALFGFADEASLHYRRVYMSLAARIGFSTTPLHGPSHAYVVHVWSV